MMCKQKLIAYVEQDKKTVPYMYINLETYDENNPYIKVWEDPSAENGGGYLKYYDCLHFYTNDEHYPISNLLNTIDIVNPRVIMLQEKVGENVEQLINNKYLLERNYIIDMDAVGERKQGIYRSKVVKRDSIPVIVDLLLTEDEYSIVYDRKSLLKQLFDRYDSGISRFYAIEENGSIIASCSSYGETKELAIVGGVIVHRDYRGRGYAFDVDAHICVDLSHEGKSCVSFVNYANKASLALHKKLGGVIYSTYYKYIRRE